MKNILNLYLIIFCLFFVAGCSSDDDAATVKLTIIKSDLDMKASGGTGTVISMQAQYALHILS